MAVLTFMATRPGKTVFNNSTLKIHPQNTRKATAIADAADAREYNWRYRNVRDSGIAAPQINSAKRGNSIAANVATAGAQDIQFTPHVDGNSGHAFGALERRVLVRADFMEGRLILHHHRFGTAAVRRELSNMAR